MAESIGHYEILGIAGTGAQGDVLRARDTRVGRTVAIRVLGGDVADPWRRAHFLENVRPYTTLSHPHIATLFEAGEQGGTLFLVYEFVPGERLGALAAGHPLNLRRALDLAIQTADALAETHACGLVHGRLTPSSVIVTPKGHAKIIDVGLSFWQAPEAPDPFLSPEQAGGQIADHRSDIYAFGAILYLILTGRPPAQAPVASASSVAPARREGPAPGRVNLDVPPLVDRIVRKALAPNPDDRYSDITILAGDLRSAAAEVHGRDGAARIDEPELHAPGRPFLRVALLVLLLLAAAGAAAWQWREPLMQVWNERFGQTYAPVLTVMPFEVARSDAARAHLGPGLAEELATRLGHIPGMRVLGRTSMRAFAGKDPRAVAEEHRASLAVTARVSPRDESWQVLELRVTLISRDSGTGIWSRSYEVQARDLLAAQAKIAQDIAVRLAGPFTPTAALRRAGLRLVEPSALDAYLQARTAMAELDTNGAVRLFEAALAADPGLIEARAGLAEALHASAAFEHRLGYAEIQRQMRQSAAEAVTADPDLAHTQLAMALASPTIAEALPHIRRALEIDPTDTSIYLAGASLVRDIDAAAALRFLAWARTLDPGQPRIRFETGAAHLVLNQPDQTLIEAARGQALAPSLPWWDALRLRVRLGTTPPIADPPPEGRGSLPGFPAGVLVRAALLHESGRTDAAVAAVNGVVRLFPSFCEARALLAGLLRSTNRAESIRLASEVYLAAASAPEALARCAALAGAATADGRQASAWISRAAGSDAGLLQWATTNGVLSAQAGIRQKVYPWSLVIGNAETIQAVRRLDAAFGNCRPVVAKVFEGLQDPLAR
jgi:serine/threonine-protein kinase